MADYTTKEVFKLFKRSGVEFSDNDSFRLAAALAFNAIFSIPPLLIIIITAAGFFFGEEAVSGKLASEISTAVGPDAATEVQKIVENAKVNASGYHLWIGIGTLIFASTTFFATLQQSLNSIWNLKVKPTNGILRMVKERVFSFGIILSIAFLMLMSFVISAIISIMSDYISSMLPADIWFWAIKLVDFLVSVGLITVLFALIYKYLPDAYIRWRDTLIGALVTAILFTIGKFLISWYLGTSNPGSAYGAAGSVILILVWIYYSSLIIFFGAEFTQQYAEQYGQHVRPKPHAVFVEQREVVKEKHDTSSGRPKPEGRFQPK